MENTTDHHVISDNSNTTLTRDEILNWLREEDEARLEALWARADAVRKRYVGDAVHLRGLVEISNHCARRCAYCGLRAGRAGLTRYRMSAGEILDCARRAADFGYGTLVMQAGEDEGITREWMTGLIRRIKGETPLAVTLSLGEREEADLAAWRAAGADRYLLRFETSDAGLFRRIHPFQEKCGMRNAECGMKSLGAQTASSAIASSDIGPWTLDLSPIPHSPFRIPHFLDHPRVAILGRLRELGYEIGSGVMVGIPGQSVASLADDLALFRALDLDMIGIGPFLPHPETPLGGKNAECGMWSAEWEMQLHKKPRSTHEGPQRGNAECGQAPATELMTLKMVALARLACPQANIPSTTALATINQANGRELGLCRGANVVMPNLTPPGYRQLYEIYPDKACVGETAEACAACLAGRIMGIGRTLGKGPGGRRERAK